MLDDCTDRTGIRADRRPATTLPWTAFSPLRIQSIWRAGRASSTRLIRSAGGRPQRGLHRMNTSVELPITIEVASSMTVSAAFTGCVRVGYGREFAEAPPA